LVKEKNMDVSQLDEIIALAEQLKNKKSWAGYIIC
jgi:hypothetical protein